MTRTDDVLTRSLVSVTFDPPLEMPADTSGLSVPFLVKRYENRISVLVPGQTLTNTWWSGKPGAGNDLGNRKPIPYEIRVKISYKGLGWRHIEEIFDLTMDTFKLTTSSVSSASFKGRLKTTDSSLREIATAITAISKNNT